MSRDRVVLVTFAGRRDRMALLTNYVERAIERGLIDEWHVWEFARDPEDSRWLRGLFPATQVTPSHTTEYFLLPERLSFDGGTATLPFSVRALNDVHIALRRISGEGASYEIVLGGWGNQGSAIRKFDRAGDIVDIAARDPQHRGSVLFECLERFVTVGRLGVDIVEELVDAPLGLCVLLLVGT